MAPLTNISSRLTPSTPIETTFGSQPVATGTKQATIVVHRNASAVNAVQVSTVTPITGAPVVGHSYQVTIGATIYTYVAIADDTWILVYTALAALIMADAGSPATAAEAAGTLVLTGKTNAGFTVAVNLPLEQGFATVPRGGTLADYVVHQMLSFGDSAAAQLEADGLAGDGSEAGKAAAAFVAANEKVSTGPRNFPPFRLVIIPNAEASFGPADEAITAMKAMRNDFLVSPYEATMMAQRNKIRDLAALISGPDRTANQQFGTTAILATQAAVLTALAINADNQYLGIAYQLDLAGDKAQTIVEIAAGICATIMQLVFPYEGLDGVEVGGLEPPTNPADKIVQGATELSELALQAGLIPLTYDSAGRVRIVRSRLTRVTIDGVTPATAYIDWQDVIPLYDFKEDMYNVLQQPQFKNKRATSDPAAGSNLAGKIKDEMIRIAKLYEEDGVFQFVTQLAPLFQVQPSATDRGRFDFFVPADVTPVLHVVAGNIQGLVFTA